MSVADHTSPCGGVRTCAGDRSEVRAAICIGLRAIERGSSRQAMLYGTWGSVSFFEEILPQHGFSSIIRAEIVSYASLLSLEDSGRVLHIPFSAALPLPQALEVKSFQCFS